MQRRHMRAIAVFAIVLVTLTGARRSGGGGCDDDSSGSSSSSGGVTSGGSSTSGGTGTTGGGTTTGGDNAPSRPNAMSDVRVMTCDYDKTTREFSSDLTVLNPSSTETMDYTVLIRVEEARAGTSTGKLLSSDSLRVRGVGPGETRSARSESFRPLHDFTTFECRVHRATKRPTA